MPYVASPFIACDVCNASNFPSETCGLSVVLVFAYSQRLLGASEQDYLQLQDWSLEKSRLGGRGLRGGVGRGKRDWEGKTRKGEQEGDAL